MSGLLLLIKAAEGAECGGWPHSLREYALHMVLRALATVLLALK